MANKKAAQKDILQTAVRTAQNRAVRSKLKTLARKVRDLSDSSSEEAGEAVKKYISALDKAVKINVIHRNSANRRKSALSKLVFK